MNFEDEEYVRLYCKDTVTVRKIGWEGRTVLWHLMRVCDRAGRIEFATTDHAVDVISVLTEIPAGIARIGISRLLRECLVLWESASCLLLSGFEGRFRDIQERHWSKVNYPTVYERDGKACRYCGCETQEALSIDHVVPRCQGGGDQESNLVVSCMPCNRRKGGRTPEQAGMVLR